MNTKLQHVFSVIINKKSTHARLRWDMSFDNFDVIYRSVTIVSFYHAYAMYNCHPARDASEDGVFSVQPLCGAECDEELAAIRVGSRVRHGQDACTWK